MAYLVFIHIIVLINLLLIINNVTSSTNKYFMKASDSNGTSFPDGIGVLAPGLSITLECLHQDNIVWSRRSSEHPEKIQYLKADDRIKISDNKLTMSNIRFEDTMVYYCEKAGVNYRFFLNVYAITNVRNGTVDMLKSVYNQNGIKFDYWKINEKSISNASCTCDSGSKSVEFDITWKGGLYTNKVSEDYSINSEINKTAKTSTLSIRKPRNLEQLFGEFSCFCEVATRANKEEKVYINVIPIFKDHEISTRSTEGLNITLSCEVWAYPPITQPIEWRFQNSTELREGIKIYQRKLNHSRISELFIPSATIRDRGVYTCHAQNDIGSNTSGFMVRVKGRYAALWPFIGIVIQVIILAAIIIAYELKKSHKPVDNNKFNYESKNEQEPGVVVRGGEATDIRQRLMVN